MDSTAQLFHRCYARRSLYVSAALPFFFFSFFFFFFLPGRELRTPGLHVIITQQKCDGAYHERIKLLNY
ncbi:hypothetical protein MGG_15377 [Pyricularia oryzae 70-15]|uniref:Uncharacterized protein n=1 Tax=Pyricularia oryzae (strain 70-15 / ATCC MYA-4617 / FGSC 8958) TaxID=242507 RepID=G4NFS6_PYRO7|nr:uncharacterized protein MGG_15377 [Pyricularia oryzae 70-15]EHA46883.1 hypothetical protein MGG_15377 [Pyricularia oryzae 70-15]